MERLHISSAEEHDRRLKEQFINGIDKEITQEIIKELTAQKNI